MHSWFTRDVIINYKGMKMGNFACYNDAAEIFPMNREMTKLLERVK